VPIVRLIRPPDRLIADHPVTGEIGAGRHAPQSRP
jgi:hypothetical protein